MSDIFIDYKRDDLAIARGFAQAFEALGFSVWYDAALLPGQVWDHAIENSIKNAKAFITLWTEKSADSRLVLDEARYALRLGHYVGVIADGQPRLPIDFQQIHHFDLREWSGDTNHPRFISLLQRIEAKVGRKARQLQTPDVTSWAAAQASGLSAAFQNFIDTFPNSPFAAEARKRLAAVVANRPSTGKVFLSYRRDDSQAVARLVFERLGAKIGVTNVFFDVDGIPLGVDFRDHMFGQLVQCSTMLAIIGRDWVGRKPGGGLRIQEATDFVRQEVELAFETGLRIIPVLAGGAQMPIPSELPEKLQRFPFIQAALLDLGRDYDPHIQRLLIAVTGEALPRSQ